ncbi:helix-turn-helix transcriptional regulator [Bacillus sp. SM2101]|uniref:helix-turn-helix domain-containing protein n=1 Tax=Bacillus sp. SM2101 TaxID=2805366 RepID=UPI001BDE4FCB|nr:helix-turn-helix transcriptional regulator [Bacillus sp. SM2101]
MQEVNSKLSKILRERNMTQRELANLSGVTQATISRFDRNSRFEAKHLFAISRALDTTIEELFEVMEE